MFSGNDPKDDPISFLNAEEDIFASFLNTEEGGDNSPSRNDILNFDHRAAKTDSMSSNLLTEGSRETFDALKSPTDLVHGVGGEVGYSPDFNIGHNRTQDMDVIIKNEPRDNYINSAGHYGNSFNYHHAEEGISSSMVATNSQHKRAIPDHKTVLDDYSRYAGSQKKMKSGHVMESNTPMFEHPATSYTNYPRGREGHAMQVSTAPTKATSATASTTSSNSGMGTGTNFKTPRGGQQRSRSRSNSTRKSKAGTNKGQDVLAQIKREASMATNGIYKKNPKKDPSTTTTPITTTPITPTPTTSTKLTKSTAKSLEIDPKPHSTINSRRSSTITDDPSPDSANGEKRTKRLARNRESARRSRKKRKQYLNLLEAKVSELTAELASERKKNEALTGGNKMRSSVSNSDEALVQKYREDRDALYNKLSDGLQGQCDETQLSAIIDSLRLRLGATGSERRGAIKYFFDQIVELVVPNHMRCLMYASQEKLALGGVGVGGGHRGGLAGDLNIDGLEGANVTMMDQGSNASGGGGSGVPVAFAGCEIQNPPSIMWQEIVHEINLTGSQRNTIKKYKATLSSERQKFQDLVHELRQVQMKILDQTNSIQATLDKLRNFLSSEQIAKLLLWIETRKHIKELSPQIVYNDRYFTSNLGRIQGGHHLDDGDLDLEEDDDDDEDLGDDSDGDGII